MAKITHMIPGLTNGVTYYGKVFSVNPKKRANNRADLAVFAAVPSDFPAEPTEYTLISTYKSAQTWIAPEKGWYLIEVHGASGSGARADYVNGGDEAYVGGGSGGSGGGGAYVASVVKMNAGDTVVLSGLAVASNASATVNTTVSGELYDKLFAVAAGNGTNASFDGYTVAFPGSGGKGGVASGGNLANVNGSDGYANRGTWSNTPSAKGGAPGHVDGNTGGVSGYVSNSTAHNMNIGPALAGFIKISRGNTNVTA